MTEKNTAAVVLAAGSGKRMNSRIKKQYLQIDGKPLIYYALRAFEQSCIEQVVLVVSSGDEQYCRSEIVDKYHFHKVSRITAGGEERYHSVLNGLHQLESCNYVLIHDGARPFVTVDMIKRSLEAAKKYQACVVGMPVKDTIKISNTQGYVSQTPDRSLLWTIQTPQAFQYNLIKNAYEELLEQKNVSVTDDAMVVEAVTGEKVKLIEGSYYNIKVTTPEDLEIAEIFRGSVMASS